MAEKRVERSRVTRYSALCAPDLGRAIVGGRGEADAVFEVREEADSADKAARVFGVAEMRFSRSV
jgi:hypothetical protein